MAAEFYLKTLGVPRLETAAGSEIRIRVRKHLAVLIVLAVEGGKVRRDRLVGMLWPTSRPDRARGSLATAISFLRGKLGGDAIEPGRDFVELSPGLVSLDLERLEKGEIIGDDFTPLLEVDAFLNGFELESLPEFEAWRDRHHARLLPAIEKGLLGLTDHSRRSGDISGLARYADRLLQLNDLSEWGIKARMEAYALSGDRITALRVYDDWVERLKSELNARPARFVEELAHRLRRPTWDPQPVEQTAPPVRTEQWKDRLFIGRSRDYRQLYGAWESTKRGDSHTLLITGDSGIGKTTLADRLATALALEGASVARVRCYELERAIPYAMISGVIEALLDRPGATATSPDALAELSRLLPAVRRSFPHLPPASDSSGEPARIRFADATLELMTSLMDEQPVIIVVDDFDHSDDTSLALLHVLVRRLRSAPLLVILTARSGHLGRKAVTAIRADAPAIGMVTLTLEPLHDEDSEALLDALLADAPRVPNTTERRTILSAAGGFPLALELLLRDWQQNGMRASPLAVRAMTGDVETTENDYWHQYLAEGLLSDFSDAERLVIYLGSILDRRVGEMTLYATSGIPHVTILGTLSKMVERRLLRDGPLGLEWINPTVRAQSYLLIPKSLRRHFHEAIASELLRQESGGVPIPKLEIAWHCMRAGRYSEASRFLLSGAKQAIIHGAPHEAELALTSGMPAFGRATQEEATLVLAEAILELNRPGEAINLLSQYSATNGRGSTADLLILKARRMLHSVEGGETREIVRHICHIVSSCPDPSTCVLALSTGAGIIEDYGHTSLAKELLRASESIKCRLLEPVDLMRLRLTQARLEYIPRQLEKALQLLLEAQQIADTYSIRHSAYLQLLNGIAAIAAAQGQYERALEASRKHFTEATKAVDHIRAGTASSNAALFCCRLGLYEEAIAWGSRSRLISGAPDYSVYLSEETIGVSRAMLGNREGALQAINNLTHLVQTAKTDCIARRLHLAIADVLMMIGERRRAMQVASLALSFAIETTADLGIAGVISRWRALLAETNVTKEEAAHEIRSAMSCPIDALDRVECLAALDSLESCTAEESAKLRACLDGLPIAAHEQLKRLGLFRNADERKQSYTIAEACTELLV